MDNTQKELAQLYVESLQPAVRLVEDRIREVDLGELPLGLKNTSGVYDGDLNQLDTSIQAAKHKVQQVQQNLAGKYQLHSTNVKIERNSNNEVLYKIVAIFEQTPSLPSKVSNIE